MGSEICVVYGAIIGLAVTVLKRIPFVGKNPKVVATVIAILVAASGFITGGSASGETIKALVLCVLTQLAGAIGTHEVAIKPIASMFVKDKA
jgi:hypothetical protein